jgi:hypothetical protein
MQGDLFFTGVEAKSYRKQNKPVSPVPSPGEDGDGRDDQQDEVREDVSSHDPESTPLTSAHLVITHGERMGFTFTHKDGRLIVSPASRLTEEDIAVIKHFKKDLLLIIWTREVWSKENNNNDLCPLSR